MATPVPRHFLDKIEALIRSNKLVVFYGAGISKAPPSNLPLAKELRNYLLEKLLGSEDRQRFKAKFENVPLEAVIEVIDRNSEKFLPSLAELFQSAQPNRNHF